MTNTKLTIKEAAQKWVNGFNAIPQSLIERAYMDNVDDIQEITPITEGDRVFSYEYQLEAEVDSIDRENQTALIDIYNENELKEVDLHDLDREDDDFLPMWGTMWTFGESIDNWWIEEQGGLQIMADCGFRVYETDELGYVFGIDGAGYDFISEHFIPLYEKRGLKWHEIED